MTDLPISPADRATTVVRRAPQRPFAISSTPSHAERGEVVVAIDRWNNEGGFVPGADAGVDPWLRRRRSGSDS